MIYSNNYLKFSFVLIMFAAIVLSCDSPVGFTKAQPEGQPDLTSFPEAFRGLYICEQDSILVKVKEDIIYSEYAERALTPMKYIQNREDCTIINDSLYMKGKKECVKIEYIKDGYVATIKVTIDTLFRLTPFQKARMYKGNLVLSQATENELWTIGLLELDGDQGITYKSIIDDSDLTLIQEITPMTKIAPKGKRYPSYKISPKEVELDELFRSPTVFVDCNYYARVNILH